MMRPVTAVVLGAGSRGNSYAAYAKEHPDQLQIVAVAEPRSDRRALFAEGFGIPEEGQFASWQELLARPRMADCAFVCTWTMTIPSPPSGQWSWATISCWKSP